MAPAATRRARPSFAARLLVAQALVLVAGALTTWLVASVVGPTIFSSHLLQAGDTHTATESRHVEEAFASALLLSTSLALLASVIAALAVSWYFSRRVQRSIHNVAEAASQIADGRYDARVPDPGLGGEFASLALTYDRLAEKLGSTESTRRSMLADLAHEMRTPLATIEAHLEAVEDGVRDLDEDTLGVIRGSTGRLRRLAEDIAAVSRAEEEGLDVTLRPMEAAGVAEAAVEVARDRYAAKGVHLHTELADAGDVRVDADRFGQVLGNLLDNALRHTPEGGAVTLTCRRVDHWVEYRVADSGEGVAPEHLPHLFDRFYRADTARDRAHGGSGIGLAIAKALVEAHGGGISVTSAGPGHGATFTVRIPRLH
ncbi:putative sensor histidine kinase [Nocardioides flavus (ex Wang et al. 2016)]|uniref:histidine kinase n=1 Tax=Nocardioides flavus (ex Wang et al. 2016) TaxID=2058780 RepID=A0ABQ3HS38_9ACTN|nr:HAMP domain-containing sensor histidine kinase [Nocardioides flavus (ex Wang et al. 2016)]GHE19462.1 putative sensor histidine kinase [Nocardioides flavus (ex Wang et al. 2016)]